MDIQLRALIATCLSGTINGIPLELVMAACTHNAPTFDIPTTLSIGHDVASP